MKPLIAILGEYQSTSETHLATDLAIADSRSQLTVEVEVEGIWVSTEDINTSLKDAQSQENNPYGSHAPAHLFISQLACSLAGRAMKLAFTSCKRSIEQANKNLV